MRARAHKAWHPPPPRPAGAHRQLAAPPRRPTAGASCRDSSPLRWAHSRATASCTAACRTMTGALAWPSRSSAAWTSERLGAGGWPPAEGRARKRRRSSAAGMAASSHAGTHQQTRTWPPTQVVLWVPAGPHAGVAQCAGWAGGLQRAPAAMPGALPSQPPTFPHVAALHARPAVSPRCPGAPWLIEHCPGQPASTNCTAGRIQYTGLEGYTCCACRRVGANGTVLYGEASVWYDKAGDRGAPDCRTRAYHLPPSTLMHYTGLKLHAFEDLDCAPSAYAFVYIYVRGGTRRAGLPQLHAWGLAAAPRCPPHLPALTPPLLPRRRTPPTIPSLAGSTPPT